MRTCINIYFLLSCLFMQTKGYSQPRSTPLQKKTGLENYQIRERIILETDRDLYMVGEEINMACYIFEPVLQRTLDLSKIVYVEFYTSQNQIIEQIKIETDQGSGGGIIKIPKLLITGRYYIRAYTNYMKNYGCDGFAYASVSILNPFREFTQENQNNSITPPLEKCVLYPEGGQVVYGCSNTIICRFTNLAGNPVPCMARVIDNNNQVISTFTSNAHGLGSFCFTPVPKTRYRVEATAGASIITANIEITDRSLALRKDYQDQDELRFRILKYQYMEYPLKLEYYQTNTSVYLSTVSAGDSVISLPLKLLPRGIIQFQLRNDRNEIVTSRSIYNPPTEKMELLLQTNKREYGNREMLELSIENYPVDLAEGALSLSVFLGRMNNMMDFSKTDSQKYLNNALYPYLREGPYPAGAVIMNDIFLDQILIIHKPTDPVPESLPSPDYANLVFFPENKQDLIFGTIVDENENPVSGFPVIQTWIDSTSAMQTTRTNTKGKFYFAANSIGGNKLILTQGKNPNGNIVLQEEFYPEFFSIAKEDFFIIPADRDELKQQMLNLQINDSYFEKTGISTKESLVPFYIYPDKIFFIDDYVPLSTLEEFLFEVVPNILPYHSKDKTIIQMQFPWSETPIGDKPLFLVDGVPVFDADLIAKLKCSDLLSVGVVYDKYFYQVESFDGILDIHSKTGDASILKIPEDICSVNFTGVQQANIHSYISVQDAKSREPYFKTQLYWDPAVNLNPDGKTTISFLTPDNTGEYIVRCGVKTADGSVVYYYTTFRVR